MYLKKKKFGALKTMKVNIKLFPNEVVHHLLSCLKENFNSKAGDQKCIEYKVCKVVKES